MTQERKGGGGRTQKSGKQSLIAKPCSVSCGKRRRHWDKGSEQIPRVEDPLKTGRWWVVLSAKGDEAGFAIRIQYCRGHSLLSQYFPFSLAPFGNLLYFLHDLRPFRILHTSPLVCCSLYFSPFCQPLGFWSATSGIQAACNSTGFFLFLSFLLLRHCFKNAKSSLNLLPRCPDPLDIPPFFSTRQCTHQSLLQPKCRTQRLRMSFFSLGILFLLLKSFLLDACPTLHLCCHLEVIKLPSSVQPLCWDLISLF